MKMQDYRNKDTSQINNFPLFYAFLQFLAYIGLF